MPETVLSLIAVFNVLFHKIIYTLSLSGAPSGRSQEPEAFHNNATSRGLHRIFSPAKAGELQTAGLKPCRNAAEIKGCSGHDNRFPTDCCVSFTNCRTNIHRLILLKD